MDERYAIDEKIEAMRGKGFGDALDWKLDSEGRLLISGKGRLPDYSCGKKPDAPWHDKKQRIKELIVEDGVTELGAKAFEACENLEAVTLPESLCRIRYCCFRGCHKLQSVTAPRNVQYKHVYEPKEEKEEKKPASSLRSKETSITLGLHSFTGTLWAIKKWGDYYIKDGVLTDYFKECEDVVIPEGIHEIGMFAFMNAQIRSVRLKEGLECIAEGAFKNTLIEEVCLPHSLRRIAYGAFAGSRLCTAVFVYGNEAQIDETAFIDTNLVFSGRLRELYELNLKDWEKGCGRYKRISVKKRKKLAGRNILDAGAGILRRIKRGAVIVGIKWDDAAKKVINVKSFVWDPLCEQPHEYLMYPYYKNDSDRREVNIWADFTKYIEEKELIDSFFSKSPERLVNNTGIRDTTDEDDEDKKVCEEWFYSRDVENFAEDLEIELLKKWLERNPDYTLKSRREKEEDAKPGCSMEC